jgi:hypothetical protein
MFPAHVGLYVFFYADYETENMIFLLPAVFEQQTIWGYLGPT